ncbi:MAG TPA: hypothetical protein VE935_22985 [Burkholderiales bacterium]|nr:hypothetical protein [Burkholderiales bacterium]
MALFDRVAAALFGDKAGSADAAAERKLVAEMTEAVVDAVEPRVRLHSRYREKLDQPVRQAIGYLRGLGRQPLEPVPLSKAAWASDPRVNAFFGTADSVAACLGRSPELRSFFDKAENAGVQEAYALLGMKKEERNVLGMELKGDAVQRDVAQVQVSFSGHRIVAPAATPAAARLEVGRRILLRLAQVALARIVAAESKATELAQHKSYLASRMRVLQLARDGMQGVVEDPAKIGEEMKALEREMKETVEGYAETKGRLATLEGYLEHIDEVFSHPQQHVSLSHTPLRISRLGVRVEGEASGPVNELALAELTLGEGFRAAIAIVQCPRAGLVSKEELIAQAERSL